MFFFNGVVIYFLLLLLLCQELMGQNAVSINQSNEVSLISKPKSDDQG